ncbi:MAG: divalent-cation tolerance protein CutA [Proteobacteria bacterium]|nr:divalent-cation tolerance protein CutA [Pseudomonadota bacterium]
MRIVLSNLPPDHADAIATALVQERLAACVNLLPVTSVYRWEGAICRDPEVTALIKVRADGVDALRERLLELHPYDLPEIVVIPVQATGSLTAYIDWVRTES